jgi:hypothetical protein
LRNRTPAASLHFQRRSVAVRVLRCAAAGLLAVYLGWNVWWLSQGMAAPSLFTALTGVPCPTTGGLRSLRLLWQGDVAASLKMNPMTGPMVILFLVSIVWPIAQASRRRRPSLPLWVFWCWVAVLASAWTCKLLGDSRFW